MDVITPPNPRTELKDKCKSKPACAESREMAKTLQKPMRNATHTGKHRKNDAKWRAEHVFGQCSPPVVAFFARKHRKYRRENKTQVQFRASKVPKLEFQHMPAKKSTHPARRQTHVLPTTTTTATALTCLLDAELIAGEIIL